MPNVGIMKIAVEADSRLLVGSNHYPVRRGRPLFVPLDQRFEAVGPELLLSGEIAAAAVD